MPPDPTSAIRTAWISSKNADRIIGDLLEHVGLPDLESLTPLEVVELASKLDYDCSPRTLTQFIERGYISGPQGPTWDRMQAYCFIAALESRRRWKPEPSSHGHKKSQARLELERGPAIDPADLGGPSTEDLLLMFVAEGDRTAREALYELLRLRLLGFEE